MYVRFLFLGLILLDPTRVMGQTPADSAAALPGPNSASSHEVEDRFQRLEALLSKQAQQIDTLSSENQKLVKQVRELSAGTAGSEIQHLSGTPSPPLPDLSVVEPRSLFVTPGLSSAPGNSPAVGAALPDSSNYFSTAGDASLAHRPFLTGLYNDGFVLVAPSDKQKTPFALKLNISTQVRYTGFYRSVNN